MSNNENKGIEEAIAYPNYINIKGFQLNFKSPILKDNIYRYRCTNRKCKYFVKLDEINLKKIINKDKNITYTEFNKHENHKEINKTTNTTDNVLTEEDINKLGTQLIINNIGQPLQFHMDNLKNNNINWKKAKIRSLLYK